MIELKIALITGASSGMGREFARQIPRLYKALDEIWVVARRTERLKELQEELPMTVRVFDGDLTQDHIYEKIEKSLVENRAKVCMLVNAAGYGVMGNVEENDIDEQVGMIDMNCRALTRMTLLCLPYMVKGSRIINLASAAAFSPQPGFSIYAASKSYVYSFSLSLEAELEDRGIHVTAVCPGPVQTEFFKRAGELPGGIKNTIKADADQVVYQALMDSAKKKSVSVYGKSMKVTRFAAKLLPYKWIARIMKLINDKGSKE